MRWCGLRCATPFCNSSRQRSWANPSYRSLVAPSGVQSAGGRLMVYATAPAPAIHRRICNVSVDIDLAQRTTRSWHLLSAAALAVATGLFSTAVSHANMEQKESQQRHPPIVFTDSVCDAFVSVLQKGGRVVYLLGTAHISVDSSNLARNLVKDVRPEAVFVELDLPRMFTLMEERAYFLHPASTADWKTVEEAKAAQESVPWVCLQPEKVLIPTSPILGWKEDSPEEQQKPRLHFRTPKIPANKLHKWSKARSYQPNQDGGSGAVQIGEEATNAMKEAVKIGSIIILGDRNIRTLKDRQQVIAINDVSNRKGSESMEYRIAEMKFWQAFQEDRGVIMTPDVLENSRLTHRLMKQVAPLEYEVLIRERDEYMSVGIDVLGQFNTMVAVVGAGHLSGMEDYLQEFGWKLVPKTCPKS